MFLFRADYTGGENESSRIVETSKTVQILIEIDQKSIEKMLKLENIDNQMAVYSN